MTHPVHRRLLAEQLLGRRRSSDARRQAAAQRSGRIDPNPHQVDAVVFALGRMQQGGCILADEVGLGKTIEAGLVVSQLRAEGARRFLLVAPRGLIGQWREELFSLFGLETREGSGADDDFSGSGVFCIGREQLLAEATHARLAASGPFDLCVVDEAHETFAGVHRRFDRSGRYDPLSTSARIAGRLLELLASQTPVMLLTATPIQNSLAELWGLVRYVDRDATLLGDLPTFRQMFCAGDDRALLSGQESDLRDRLRVVLRRTLRRQAQEFMRTPFVGRRTRLFEYEMSDQERSLYEDVTGYLLRPGLCAFRGSNRRLLLLGFHRRMASSLAALGASLERVAERLRGMLAGRDTDPGEDFSRDLEDDEEPEHADLDEGPAPPAEGVRRELSEVEGFVQRVAQLPGDAKARALVEVVRTAGVRDRSGKLVVFTESRVTQQYLAGLLTREAGVEPTGVTLFNGDNDSPRAREALDRWQREVGAGLRGEQRPSRSVAMRLALVHEFRTRSQVLISTEAGAKGLNLQFCDTLVNYDLPWNPQRIEQRIGRCHRYGQRRDVTVINFSARDNAAGRHTLEILGRKLNLFGTVLDASDRVLHDGGHPPSDAVREGLAREVVGELSRIHDQARSVDQIEEELRRLTESIDARRVSLEKAEARMAGLIESRFDDVVREAFRGIERSLPGELAALDRDVERLLCDYLDGEGVAYARHQREGHVLLEIEASERLPEGFRQGTRAAVGDARRLRDATPIDLSHPLVLAAAEAARVATEAGVFRLRLSAESAAPELLPLRGRRGRLSVLKLRYAGFEPEERLLAVATLEGAPAPLGSDTVLSLLRGPLAEIDELSTRVTSEELEEAIGEAAFVEEATVAAEEDQAFRQAIARLERSVEDRLLVLLARRRDLSSRLTEHRRQRADATGSLARGRVEQRIEEGQRSLERIDAELERLRFRRDDDYQRVRRSAFELRYAPPDRQSVLEAEFVIE